MKKLIKQIVGVSLLLASSSAFAWHWHDLWQTGDQQGMHLLRAGKAAEAANAFKNPAWQAVALYRSGNYAQAFQQFSSKKTSDNQYNAGNAAAYLGHYQEAIDAYDKALALNSNNTDARTNREIIKKLLEKKNQSQNNSANNSPTDKANKNSGKQPDSPQNHSSAKNNNEKPNGQSNSQQEKSAPQQANNSQQKTDEKPQNQNITNLATSQNQAENKKQMLRRLEDNPGGLLQQKFQRDYYQRHMGVEDSGQGEN